MNDDDDSKRKKAGAEKKRKLANTLYFVSPTRLSIRNLDKSLPEGTLKGHCLAALKKALNAKLVAGEDVDRHLVAQGYSARERTPALTRVPPIRGGAIRNIRLMKDLQRLRDGTPQSRGYAFVEFTCHAHALAVLREMNNR